MINQVIFMCAQRQKGGAREREENSSQAGRQTGRQGLAMAYTKYALYMVALSCRDTLTIRNIPSIRQLRQMISSAGVLGIVSEEEERTRKSHFFCSTA